MNQIELELFDVLDGSMKHTTGVDAKRFEVGLRRAELGVIEHHDGFRILLEVRRSHEQCE